MRTGHGLKAELPAQERAQPADRIPGATGGD